MEMLLICACQFIRHSRRIQMNQRRTLAHTHTIRLWHGTREGEKYNDKKIQQQQQMLNCSSVICHHNRHSRTHYTIALTISPIYFQVLLILYYLHYIHTKTKTVKHVDWLCCEMSLFTTDTNTHTHTHSFGI